MTIDHISVGVPEDKYQAVLKFYQEALKPLGYVVKQQFGPTVSGLGVDGMNIGEYNHADFWLFGTKETPNFATHVAFEAADCAAVDAFHAAAIKAGAEDNGAPGMRNHYHKGYYGAFIRDPLGNNVEAVFHHAE